MTATAALERTLHDEIPLTRAMDVRVAAYDGNLLRLTAPLSPNVNDKGTAFGGSLYSLAVLCGWSLLHLKVKEAGLSYNIVIQDLAGLVRKAGETHADGFGANGGVNLPEAVGVALVVGAERCAVVALAHRDGRRDRGNGHLRGRLVAERGDACDHCESTGQDDDADLFHAGQGWGIR